jgi:hypothetical protein
LETNHVPICVDNQTRSVSHRSEDVVIDHVADLRRKRQGNPAWVDLVVSMDGVISFVCDSCGSDRW